MHAELAQDVSVGCVFTIMRYFFGLFPGHHVDKDLYLFCARDSEGDVCAPITGSLKSPLSHSCEPNTGGHKAMSCSFQQVIKYGVVWEELLKISFSPCMPEEHRM